MRVTVVSHLYPSEREPLRGTFVAEQVRALAERVEVDVICPVFGGEDERATREGVEVRYLGLPWPKRLPSKVSLTITAAAYRRRLLEVLRTRPRPDVIHAHYGFPDGVACVRVARELGVPCVVTLHGDDANVQMRLPGVGSVMAHALEEADAIVCVSEAMRKEVAKRHPRLASKLVTIPNGYDAATIGFEPKLPAEHLLSIGALLPVKAPELLISAYARIAKETPLDLVLAGTGPLEEDLRAQARHLGIRSRVHFLGRLEREQVAAELRRAKALVLPSRHEGMPIVVLEALATGTPVVASAVGGIPEVVADDRFGLLVPKDDEGALAEALREAISREWDETEIASAAPILTWEENAEEVLDLYAKARAGAVETRRLAYLSLQATTEGQAAHAHVHGIVRGLERRGWIVDLYEPQYKGTCPSLFERLMQFAIVQWRMLPNIADVDAVYCRSHFAAVPTTLQARHMRVPIVHEVNGTWEDIFLAYPWTRRAGRFFSGITRWQWQLADALVTVTRPLARWAGEESGGTPVHVVPNAADTSIFRPGMRPLAGLPERYVVFVGALAPWQGIPALLEATGRPEWPEGVSLVVVGDGQERSAVKRAVKAGRPVVYLGRQPYKVVPHIMAGAIASVSPQNAGGGRSESGLSPVKVYESLACDTPVIVTDYPGQSELVDGTSCGLVVPPEEPAELASAVARIVDDPEQALRMGRHGGAAVRAWHSWDVRAGDIDEILRELVALSPRVPGAVMPRLSGDE